MKSVSIIALQSHVDAASLDFSATGVAADEEAGQLLEDTLRGVIALWRMAVQEQQPDYVAVVRKIQVTRDGTSVSVTGSLPMELLTRLSDRSR